MSLSGFSLGKFPIRYLGAPLFHGQPRLSYFQNLVDAVKNRIEGWMKSFLSMAGRLTLIKSVLCSIPIHTLSALPVPKGTMEAIDKHLRSFLWGSGGSASRHWVNWNTICTDFQAGGLGIRPLRHLMTALRGKLAWKYLCNDSLWAKHARSRFTIGGKGSHLWKSVSPFITSIAHDCYWRLGNGNTPVNIFCQNIAMPFPKMLKDIRIKDVLSNPDYRRTFMHNVHPRIHLSLNNTIDDSREDQLLWSKDPNGVVTTKSFWKSFAPPSISIQRFKILWQSWIPLKVSCFLWKILHSALPTNENVMRAGISMASRCVCCADPGCESMDHLFLHGNLACILWDFLCQLFNKPRPNSIPALFYDWGINARFSKFSDCLGFGLVSLCLWEIWKARNGSVFEGVPCRFNKGVILNLASSLAKSIPDNCSHDFKSRVICYPLHISVPLGREFKVSWRSWMPVAHDNSCNLAIFATEDRACISAIIRDFRGVFIHAIKITTIVKHFLKCLLQILHEIRMLGISYGRIQTSHEDISLLDKNATLEWKFFQIKCKLVKDLHNVAVFRVSYSLNKPSEALCYSTIENLSTPSYMDLPAAVQVALDHDGYPHPCSRLDQEIFL